MQKDTRTLTVAQEHLTSALEEVSFAQGQTERSMAEAAIRRALDHMNLVTRRLLAEQGRLAGTDTGTAVERAFASAQRGWQGLHDYQREWPHLPITEVRADLEAALEAINDACRLAPSDALHA